MFRHAGVAQTALVLLNKGGAPATFRIADYLQPGEWKAMLGGGAARVVGSDGVLEAEIPAHGAEVFVLDAEIAQSALQARLRQLMAAARRTTSAPPASAAGTR